MNSQLEKYNQIISSLEIPESITFDDFRDLILGNMVAVNSRLEKLYVYKDRGRTIKASNLQFRITDLLETTLEKLANIIGGNPVAVILNVMQFVKDVLKLSDISIAKNDAQVLIALWLIQREKPENVWPEIDELMGHLKNEMTEMDLEKSLTNLEKLRCIERMNNGQIQIVEEIEFPNSE